MFDSLLVPGKKHIRLIFCFTVLAIDGSILAKRERRSDNKAAEIEES